MPIKVYHASLPNPVGERRDISGHGDDLDDPGLHLIAHMRTDSLEEAFAWSQRLDHPWHEDPDHVLFLHPGPYPSGAAFGPTPRSTSVGDVLEECGSFARWRVAPMGFEPLPARPSPSLQFPLHPTEWRKLFVQVWDVALAWRLIALRPDQTPDGYANLQHYRPQDLTGWLGVDEARAMSDETDVRVPILIVPVGDGGVGAGENPKEFTPIDGHHRIFKALTEGRPGLPAYRLTPLEGAIVDETAARFGNRTQVARYHTCGQRLTRYTQTRDKQRFTWFADETTPLLTRCPRCGTPLTSGTVRVHRPRPSPE